MTENQEQNASRTVQKQIDRLDRAAGCSADPEAEARRKFGISEAGQEFEIVRLRIDQQRSMVDPLTDFGNILTELEQVVEGRLHDAKMARLIGERDALFAEREQLEHAVSDAGQRLKSISQQLNFRLKERSVLEDLIASVSNGNDECGRISDECSPDECPREQQCVCTADVTDDEPKSSTSVFKATCSGCVVGGEGASSGGQCCNGSRRKIDYIP